jgi:hypothetical protein
MRNHRVLLGLAMSLALPGFASSAAGAQGTCTTSGAAACTAPTPSNNTQAIELTITRAVRLSLSSTNIALLAATAGAFDTTYGTTTGPTLTVKANQGWNVTTRVTSASWAAAVLGGSGATPRANKPAADLLWATSAAGPFTAYSTTNVQMQSSTSATAGTVLALYFRVNYSWVMDTPGLYSIPVQFTITAP